MTITTAPRTLASTAFGEVVECDGIVYLLTQCCRASAKGSSNVASGVVCRACYREISGWSGWAALASDADGTGETQMAAMLRPSVGHLSDRVARAIFESARRNGYEDEYAAYTEGESAAWAVHYGRINPTDAAAIGRGWTEKSKSLGQKFAEGYGKAHRMLKERA